MRTLSKTTVQTSAFFQSLPANQNGNRIYKYLGRFHSTLPPILLTLKMETESTSTWSDFIPHFLPFCRLLGLLLLCDTETKITSATRQWWWWGFNLMTRHNTTEDDTCTEARVWYDFDWGLIWLGFDQKDWGFTWQDCGLIKKTGVSYDKTEVWSIRWGFIWQDQGSISNTGV